MKHLSPHFFKVSCLCSALALSVSNMAYATECAAKSSAQTLPLLELYTSEGCSSCPPADEWLSTLKASSLQMTPLAFHVDYWDYIGWKDLFAKAEYSERQRKNAALGGAGFVYTPQFTLGGKDFRGVTSARFKDSIANIAKQPARANLNLKFTHQTNREIILNANAAMTKTGQAKNAQVFIAIYQNQLTSKVNAGENSGRILKHDYVVREFFGGYPFSINFSKDIKLTNEWQERDAGAVMFVQDSKTGEVLQSLQLPLCKTL